MRELSNHEEQRLGGKKDLELLKGEQRTARRTRRGRGAFRRTNRFKDGGTG